FVSSKKRGMYPCVHHHAKETKLRNEKSCKGKVDQWQGGECLHPRRRTQPPRALDSISKGRKGKGFARCQVSYRERGFGYGRCCRKDPTKIQVRCKTTQKVKLVKS